jgi:hypothetical protein
LKHPTDLWGQIWRQKYANRIPEEELIQMEVPRLGSMIWKNAYNNRVIVQTHSFWEIREGASALFWEDAWKQENKLTLCESLRNTKDKLKVVGWHRVQQYWQNTGNLEPFTYQKWRTGKQLAPKISTEERNQLESNLSTRKINALEGTYIPKWGAKGYGNFKVKYAYEWATNQTQQDEGDIWNKIWNSELWPKISMFLWLLTKKKTLTWDTLVKRGFEGPSICHICQREEETTEHLFNGCVVISTLRDRGATTFRQSNRVRDNIIQTIEGWRQSPFHNPIANRVWNIFPGLLLCNVWKEPNRRIFKD